MQHHTVTAAILTNKSKYLCMQRGSSKYAYVAGKYEFPGGKAEPGESNEEALRRELFEEMKIDLEVLSDHYYMSVDHTYPDFSITMHCYLIPVGDIRFELVEHIDYKWCELMEIEDLDWAPADVPIVRKLRMDGMRSEQDSIH